MQRLRNILVGVDLSNGGQIPEARLTAPNRQALHRAIWLAQRTKGEVTIFTALDLPPLSLLGEEFNRAAAAFERAVSGMLERFVAEAREKGVHARQKLTFGVPWREICRQVLADKHDLVVVGTRDLGRVSRILLGSTGMKLLRSCPCPVWIDRPDSDFENLNTLVPSDFSDVSLEALRVAVEAGRYLDARIHLLHAQEGHLGPPAWFGHVSSDMVQDYLASQRAEAKKKLHEQLGQTDYRTLQHGAQVHVVDGPTDEAILKAIDDFQINLVVMGTSARSGIPSVVLGNTAERIFSHIQCSLIAVKPGGFQCPVTLDGHDSVPVFNPGAEPQGHIV